MAEESDSEVRNDEITQAAAPDVGSREETEMSLGLHLSPENTSMSIGIVYPKFNVKSKSSMKSILLDYGLPDDEVQRLQQQESETTKKKKKHKTNSFVENDEGTKGRRGKKESYLAVFNDTYKSPDYVVEDVMEKLTEKVDRQRKMIQKRSELMEKNRLEQEEQQRQKRLQKKKARVDLHHNDTFMKQLPKSQFYKLVSIEDRLKAKGLLKHQVDIDDFWQSVRNPDVLERYTKSALSATDLGQEQDQSSQPLSSASTSSISSLPGRKAGANKENSHMDFRPMTQISEGGESSRPTTKDEYKTVSSPYSSRKSPSKRRDPHSIARAAAQELEKKYPMVELPPMACFTMELGDQAPDPQHVMEEMAAERREKERLLYVKRVRKMYNLAQSHKAATHRILEKHGGEFDMLYEGENSIMAMLPCVEEPEKPVRLTEAEREAQIEAELLARRPWLRHIRSREALPPPQPLSEPHKPKKKSAAGKRKPVKRQESEVSERGSSAGSRRETPQTAATKHEDLSLNSLQEHSKVVESKALSTLWPNYLGGCKSVYAK